MSYVNEGWWHPNVKSGQVHDHNEHGRGWSPTMHSLCEPVYTCRESGSIEFGPLNVNTIVALATIFRAAQTTARVRWLDEHDNIIEGVARAITRDGGGFLAQDEDVRAGYLHVSCMGELWLPVMKVVDMVKNGLFVIDDPR